MYLSVRRSQQALLAIGFFVIMILTVFSTLLYFAERGTWDEALDTFISVDGDPTQFASIPGAARFVIVSAYWFLHFTSLALPRFPPSQLSLSLFSVLPLALPSYSRSGSHSNNKGKPSFARHFAHGSYNSRRQPRSFVAPATFSVFPTIPTSTT
ncbi:hypothetical protein H1R20_g6629, partial [Candolleomyces eurysporus]